MFDSSKASHAIRFIENLKHTKSPFQEQPFKLLDWQLPIVSDVYGTVDRRGVRQYRYVYLEIPKKNGKSELVAALALYHLFADHEVNGQVYGCAGDKEQATLVFDVAVEMIDYIPGLKKRAKLNLSTKMITDKKSGTFYKVVSAEAYTKHGLNLTACIFDELHVQPNRDLFDVMTKGAGDARVQPIWWIITTAGDDPDRVSIGWEVHEKAESILHARKIKDKEKDIPTWYPVIYSYQGEDVYNEKNWKIANPSIGKTFDVTKIREAAMEAKLSPADERLFRWLRLNQWVTTKLTTWLPLDLFDATTAKDWTRADLIGEECFMGLDLSSTTDLSASCLVFPPQKKHFDWRVIWDCWIPEENMKERIRQDKVPYNIWAADGFVYPTSGNVIDYDLIEQRILECNDLYRAREVDADKTFAGMLLQRLQQRGMECVDIPQTYAQLTDPLNEIERLLRSKITVQGPDGKPMDVPMLTHEPHPVARWCFGNTAIHKNGNAQIKFVKESKGRGVVRTKRIDLTAAWVFASSRAKFYDTNKSIYEQRGLLTL